MKRFMVLLLMFLFVLVVPALAQERSAVPAGQQPVDPQLRQALGGLQDRLNQVPGARGGGARGVPSNEATAAYLRELERFVNKANGPVIVNVTAGAWWTNMIVIGAGLGIGRFAAAAAEAIGRQPAAAAQITSAVSLPLFLLEGVAIIGEVVVLLIVFK